MHNGVTCVKPTQLSQLSISQVPRLYDCHCHGASDWLCGYL